MADMLVRDVPDDVVAALDARAGRLGLRAVNTCGAGWPRTTTPQSPVNLDDFTHFAEAFADLADPEVMSRAWRCDLLAD